MMEFCAQVELSTLYRSRTRYKKLTFLARHTTSRPPFAMCNVIICIMYYFTYGS